MSGILGFAILAGILTITPGLDTFLVLRSALAGGRKTGLATALGVCSGLIVWALASAAGVTAILVASQRAFNMLQIAGAAYLVWMGLRNLVAALGETSASPVDSTPAGRTSIQTYRIGLMSNLLNPKVSVFYLAVFPQFLPDDGNTLFRAVGLAALHIVEGMIWLSAIAWFGARARHFFSRPAAGRLLDTLSGLALVAFGAHIIRQVRPG